MAEARRSRVAETLGRARGAVGSLWLRTFIWQNRRCEPAALLELTWLRASQQGRLFSGLERYKNKFRHEWRDILFLQVLHHLDSAGVGSVPKVAVRGFEIVRSAAATKPTMVVVVHSPVDAVLNRLFEEACISWITLAQRAEPARRKARLLGLSGPLEVVPQTSDALLALRRILAQRRAVCACVDFAYRPDRAVEANLLVSPALFDLAKRTGAAVVYAHTKVTDDGVIDVTCAAPRIDPSNTTPEAWAEDFAAWLHDDQGDRRSWAVRKWDR